MSGERTTDSPGALEPTVEQRAAPPRPASARISGTRKAAVLMAAIGSERAANVLQRLGDDEIESLSLEMARLNAVGVETTESVFTEIAASTGPDAAANVSGGAEFAREVVERALGAERAVELLGRLSGGTEVRPFEFLHRVPVARIAALLRSESPQTSAVVIANLPANLAAGTLAALPAAQQPEIALRIARVGDIAPAVIERVEGVLRKRVSAVGEQQYQAAGGPKVLAEILSHAERSVERNVLEGLADGELAEQVRSMLFVFEDIVKLDERAIQQVLREVDQKDLVLALRGAPQDVLDAVLGNMSERGAAMLKEEMEIQQPQRKRDVEQAQGRVVAVVRKLEEAGTIVIASGGGEDEEESEPLV